MEPVSVTTILGVIRVIVQVASAASAFMRDVRSARKEILDMKKELSSLRAVLEILEEDFRDPANANLPSSVVDHIVDVATNCSKVVAQIGDCIQKQGRSGFNWAISGKEDIAKLRANLQNHKSTLNLTLDLISKSVYFS